MAAADRRGVEHRRPEQLVGQGDRGTGPGRGVEAAAGPLQQHVAGQGVAVAPQPGRGQPDQHVAGTHPGRAQDLVRARPPRRRTRPGRTRRGFMTPGCSAISPPMRLAPTCRHPSATPDTSSAIWAGSTAARRDVVEEEQRLGPLAHQVVHAHGHQVDPDGVEPAEGLGHQRLGPHPVGAGHQDRVRAVPVGVQLEEPAEVARGRRAPRAGAVEATMGLIRSTARSPASMSTPAPA